MKVIIDTTVGFEPMNGYSYGNGQFERRLFGVSFESMDQLEALGGRWDFGRCDEHHITVENPPDLDALRQYVQAKGWTIVEGA